VSDQLHAPDVLPTGKEPPYPLDRRLSGPQSRSGRRGEERILNPTGTRNSDSDSSVVQSVARRVGAFKSPGDLNAGVERDL
jgi:hypothetical protein